MIFDSDHIGRCQLGWVGDGVDRKDQSIFQGQGVTFFPVAEVIDADGQGFPATEVSIRLISQGGDCGVEIGKAPSDCQLRSPVAALDQRQTGQRQTGRRREAQHPVIDRQSQLNWMAACLGVGNGQTQQGEVFIFGRLGARTCGKQLRPCQGGAGVGGEGHRQSRYGDS